MTNAEALAKFEQDMELRGFSHHTIKSYLTRICRFLSYLEKEVDKLNENDVRIFLSYLDKEAKLSPGAINGYNSGIRFFYEVTLEKDISYKRLPRKKDPIKVPIAFTTEEVIAFFSVIDNSKYRAVFSLAYGCGLRLNEIINLKISDIDSKQMRVFINQGKGQKDRFVPLGKRTLVDLRQYYSDFKPTHEENYLFLNDNSRNKVATGRISERSIQDAFKKYHKKSNIKTQGTTHTFRNSYATHLLEEGVNVFFIQRLLGHATLWTTMRYLKIAMTDLMRTESPLDKLALSVVIQND